MPLYAVSLVPIAYINAVVYFLKNIVELGCEAYVFCFSGCYNKCRRARVYNNIYKWQF